MCTSFHCFVYTWKVREKDAKTHGLWMVCTTPTGMRCGKLARTHTVPCVLVNRMRFYADNHQTLHHATLPDAHHEFVSNCPLPNDMLASASRDSDSRATPLSTTLLTFLTLVCQIPLLRPTGLALSPSIHAPLFSLSSCPFPLSFQSRPIPAPSTCSWIPETADRRPSAVHVRCLPCSVRPSVNLRRDGV